MSPAKLLLLLFPLMATAQPRLRVSGDHIVDQKGDTICLRGFGLGGMLHMENFIDGYPANEEAMREGLKKVLGEKRYDLYFDTFLKNYFTESDAAYVHSLGLNLIRIPINYHLFEDDLNPGVIKQGTFAYLDSVIERCARHRIYTIIDLHALPGAQNQHWHSDNPTHVASFWIHKEFQDRTVHLWTVIARRYKDQPWVAGYDLINEPADPSGERLFPYYKRLRDAIRKIDPDHILFLEGDRYATEFERFTEVWPNVVYTNHDYAAPGFNSGGDYPGYTNGRYYDKDSIEKDFLGKSGFMLSHHVPIWVGEFGPVYSGNSQKDEMHYQVLKDQLAYYKRYKVSWCIWLYKDMGLQAIMHQEENTPYMRLVSKFLARKDSLGADAWGSTDKNIRQVIAPLEELFKKEFPGYDPYPRGQQREIALLVRHTLIAEALLPEYCNLFKGLSDEQIVALARSFRYENYVKRTRLEDILTGREQAASIAGQAAGGWIPLFNGKDLEGWDIYLKGTGLNPASQQVFTVITENNEKLIRISGEVTGGLSTKKEFENYHLQLLFKWGSLTWGPKKGKKKDSGLLYHSVGPYGADNGAWMRSQEFQVEQTNVGDYWGCAGATADIPATKTNDSTYSYDPNGIFYTFRPDTRTGRHCIKAGDAENPTGEWNTLDLYCHGDTAVHVVNGKTLMILYHCAQLDNGQLKPLTQGKIQLQSEGAEVFYKQIRIQPIAQLPAEILSK